MGIIFKDKNFAFYFTSNIALNPDPGKRLKERLAELLDNGEVLSSEDEDDD